MSEFINGGQRWQCPACQRLQIFDRPILESMLPVKISCSFSDCKYTISYSQKDIKPQYPKVDPLNILKGHWQVELSQGQVKEYWKPATGQVSFADRCNAIATHVAGGLQAIDTLKKDLDMLAKSFTDQFHSEWSLATSFLKYWNPVKVNSFIKSPFCCIPVVCQDKFLTARTRIFLHPDFYAPKVGYPLQSFGGYSAQMVTPYTLINFPLETHLAEFMQLMELPDLRVVGDLINGRDLYRCWRDIPGTVPDREHSDEAPLLRINEPHLARPWLARLGINPWNVGELDRQEHAYSALWTYFKGDSCTGKQKDVFKAFATWGRIALFFADPMKAWEVAATIGGYMFGEKLALISNASKAVGYKTVVSSCVINRANTSFHWKEIKSVEDVPDSKALRDIDFMIVYYDAEFPPEALAALYTYSNRLILIANDPLMDTLSENWEASLLFGLVSQSIWQPDLPAVNAHFDWELDSVKESLVGSLLRQWVMSSRIARGGS